MSSRVIDIFSRYFRSLFFTAERTQTCAVLSTIRNTKTTAKLTLDSNDPRATVHRVTLDYSNDHGVNFARILGVDIQKNAEIMIYSGNNEVTVRSTPNVPAHIMYQIRRSLTAKDNFKQPPPLMVEFENKNSVTLMLLEKWLKMDTENKKRVMVNMNQWVHSPWTFSLKSNLTPRQKPFKTVESYIFKNSMFVNKFARCPIHDMLIQYANEEENTGGKYYSSVDVQGYGVIKEKGRTAFGTMWFGTTGYVSQAMRKQYLQGLLEYHQLYNQPVIIEDYDP